MTIEEMIDFLVSERIDCECNDESNKYAQVIAALRAGQGMRDALEFYRIDCAGRDEWDTVTDRGKE